MSSDEGQPLVGRVLGGTWEVLRLIGHGPYSAVYEAAPAGVGARVALKVLPLPAADAATVERLREAVRAQASLDHPAIVRAADVVVDGPVVAVVLELVEGPSLADLLTDRGGALDAAQVREMGGAILEALAVVHGRGLVHGDLRPGNVLLSMDGRRLVPRLAEVGLARAVAAAWPALAPSLLSPRWAAPEVLRGAAPDARSDLYAAGVVLYEMATGRPPFAGALWDVVHGHVEEPPPGPRTIRPDLPAEIEAVILKALEKEPRKRWLDAAAFSSALRAVASERAAQTDEEVALERIGALQRALQDASTGEARAIVLVEIGDLWLGRLEMEQKAIESWAEALEARPGDETALARIVETCGVSKRWDRAVRFLERALEREKDPKRRARHRIVLATLHRDEIGDLDRAARQYDAALDDDPDALAALEALGRLLTERKDWHALDDAYRRMLARVAGRGAVALEANLWNLVGELNRTYLARPQAATEAFEAASRLDPGDVQRRATLADLYAATPGREVDAAAAHQALIARDPSRIESYRFLRRVWTAAGRLDAAWCASAALVFLDKADEEESRVFLAHRAKGPIRAQSRLDHERWIKDLFHPDEDVFVGKIFDALMGPLRAVKVRDPKHFGLKPEERRDPLTDTVAFSRTFGYVAQVLSLPLPQLYLRPDQAGGLAYVATDPPASVVGGTLLSGFSPQELAFVVARHLAYYRGEHYVRCLVPAIPELATLLLAGLKMGASGFEPPAETRGAVQTMMDALTEGPVPPAMDALRLVCRRFLEADRRVDLERWAQCVELTACRAGLLLCNDLSVAVRILDAMPQTAGDLPSKEKTKELLAFAVSEEYLKLRQTLGIAIG